VLGPSVDWSPSYKDLLYYWIGHATNDDQVGNPTRLDTSDKVIKTNSTCRIKAYQRHGSR
jgi:hypothetical protein